MSQKTYSIFNTNEQNNNNNFYIFDINVEFKNSNTTHFIKYYNNKMNTLLDIYDDIKYTEIDNIIIKIYNVATNKIINIKSQINTQINYHEIKYKNIYIKINKTTNNYTICKYIVI